MVDINLALAEAAANDVIKMAAQAARRRDARNWRTHWPRLTVGACVEVRTSRELM